MPHKAAQSTDDPAQPDPVVTNPVITIPVLTTPAIADPDVPQQEVDPEEVSTPGTPLPDDSSPNLAQAILLMTSKLRRREDQSPTHQAKAKEPDTFDGSDLKKLNNFILLCNLYFRNNPAYSDDARKVTFALSYLRGTALEYFEPSILDSDDTPDWMDDWSAFL